MSLGSAWRRLILTMSDAANPGHQNVVIKLVLTAKLLAMLSCFAAGGDQNGVTPAIARILVSGIIAE